MDKAREGDRSRQDPQRIRQRRNREMSETEKEGQTHRRRVRESAKKKGENVKNVDK